MSKKELIEMIFHHFYNGPTYAYECFPPIDFTIVKNGVKYNGGSVPTYVAGRSYEINVCDGLAVVGEFY